jgi:hypothetical protein
MGGNSHSLFKGTDCIIHVQQIKETTKELDDLKLSW